MPKIRLGIIGVGNCASNLVQGIYYYKNVKSEGTPGLMHPVLGGYKLFDITPVLAIDVDSRKVGKDLSESIFSQPNNTVKIADVPDLGVKVLKGPVLDGVGEYLSQVVSINHKQKVVDVAKELKAADVEVLLNLLPVGSAEATRFYASEALKAGCGVVNAIPEFIASDASWAKKFEKAGLPVIGDDSKAQFGSTIVHRVLTRLCQDRGVVIDNTYQLNVGGNLDFLNMLERSRLVSKKISKTEAVQSQMDKRLPDEKVHVGPSDYVPWLNSRKLGFIRIEGRLFADIPFNLECRLDVDDKANSSGVLIDAIRCLKVGLDRSISGVLTSPSAYFCKHPPEQFPDSLAKQMVEEFIAGKRDR